MFPIVRLGSILLSAVVLLACTPGENTPDSPLVVDITAVAKALGRDEVMEQQLAATRDQLNRQLDEITHDLNSQLEEKQAELAEQADEAQTQELQALALQARQTLEQTRALAQQKALAYRSSLVLAFQEEVRAEAAEIARQRGATSVMLANVATLWFDPRTDITGEVIARMRAAADRSDRTKDAGAATQAPDSKQAR
ncbi:MAG: hypothetical protein CMN57_13080 [Gammaproteobacteria bacterium]|nr:hypothetical protein [Gammaproteobacteria bacterium]